MAVCWFKYVHNTTSIRNRVRHFHPDLALAGNAVKSPDYLEKNPCAENSKSDPLKIFFFANRIQSNHGAMMMTPSSVCETHLFLAVIVVPCGYFNLILQTLLWNGT